MRALGHDKEQYIEYRYGGVAGAAASDFVESAMELIM
jgi:hypothetical protein